MKILRTFLIVSIIGLLYSSCVKKENYPNYPVITYNTFIPFGPCGAPDSAYLRVNFTDGNGQIGYPAGQEGAPLDFFIIPMMFNTNTLKYDTIKHENVANTADTVTVWAYAIPYITPSGSDKALNGIIQINFETSIKDNISQTNGHDYTKLEFSVWMYDRAGNKSNVLTTPPVSTCPTP